MRRVKTIAGAELSTKLLITPATVVLNVLVFVITAVQGRGIDTNFASPLYQEWALFPPSVADGESWRLLTSGFLHAGPMHLALNMLALWLIGRELEPVLGRLRYTGIYLLSLLGGSTAAYLIGETCVPTVGASGAVFGLMGGLLAVLVRLKLSLAPALTTIGLNVVISFVVPNISIEGHLGGLVIGGLLTVGMVYPPAKQRNAWQLSAVIAVVVVLAVLVMARNGYLADATVLIQPIGNGDYECVVRR